MTVQVKGYHFDSGPSFFAGLSGTRPLALAGLHVTACILSQAPCDPLRVRLSKLLHCQGRQVARPTP